MGIGSVTAGRWRQQAIVAASAAIHNPLWLASPSPWNVTDSLAPGDGIVP